MAQISETEARLNSHEEVCKIRYEAINSQIEPGVSWRFPVSMRATPGTITLYSPAASGATNGQWTNDGNGSYSANARAIFQNSEGLTIDNTGILLAASQPWIIHATADAEL